jgi:hypothetical protein
MCTLGDAADVNPVIKFLRHALQRVSQELDSCDNYVISPTDENKNSTAHFAIAVQLQLFYSVITLYYFLFFHKVRRIERKRKFVIT